MRLTPFLSTDLRQLVFEAPIVEAEVVLDGLVARDPHMSDVHRLFVSPPGRLVAASDDAPCR